MKLGNIKLFRDKFLLSEMLALRYNGWSFTSIAFLFSCDRKSIENQCRKYGIKPMEDVYTIERISNSAIKDLSENKWVERNGEKINKGMSYEDYLKKQYPHRKNASIR